MRCGVLLLSAAMLAQVAKPQVAGVTNFARVGSIIACAGAITPESVAELKKLGFVSIVNLREATETAANLDAEMDAAAKAGLHYVHLPLNARSPDPIVVAQFLQIVIEPANRPALVHDSSGDRAAALWLIKRLVVDGWDTDRALKEATALGLTSEPLKVFALDYAVSHRR